MPVLELDDGTRLYQSLAIHQYVASITGFAPKDAMEAYKGQMLYEACLNDIFFKHIGPACFKPAGEERDEMFK